jgi:hypothetical protein
MYIYIYIYIYIYRIHHSIADGISLVNALSKILTDENGLPLTSVSDLPSGTIYMYMYIYL